MLRLACVHMSTYLTFCFCVYVVEPKDAAVEVSLRVAFGCGLYNEVTFGEDDDSRNPISGVMGLGMGNPSSLVSQLRPVIMDRFSYCIPPLFPIDGADLQDTEGATLDFGPDAVLTGDAVQSTRLLDPTFLYNQYYMINVTNFSVDGVRGFLPAGGMTFGIDSIAPYSTMFEGYYQQLRDVVAQYFQEKHGLAPLNETQSGFGLCYELDKDGERAQFLSMTPAIMLQMEGGASLELQNMFQWFNDEGCLAIISVIDDRRVPNMLGVYQQMSYWFLFELNASKLSFSPNKC